MRPADLVRANLPLVDRVIAQVCRRAGVSGADAEDLASEVKVALLQNDRVVLRRNRGAISLGAFVATVARNLLFDQRMAGTCRWRPSTEARRAGAAGVLLDRLLRRDRRSIEESMGIVQASHPAVGPADLRRIAERLPLPVPRRDVRVPAALHDLPSPHRADDRAVDGETREICRRVVVAMRRALAALNDEDHTIIRLRFAASMTVAGVARAIDVPQRPLYRRIEALLRRFRSALNHAGVDDAALSQLLERPGSDMNFGLVGGRPRRARISGPCPASPGSPDSPPPAQPSPPPSASS